jgi:hypothetical protein
VALVVVVVSGAVLAHHTMPGMPGMAMAVACLAVLAVGVGVAVAITVRGPVWRPVAFLMPPAPALPLPHRLPARAGPLHLALLVLRR